MKYFLTIVSNTEKTFLSDDILDKIKKFVSKNDISITDIESLSDGQAYDFSVEFDESKYQYNYRNVKEFLKDYEIDCFLIADSIRSIKKLLMLDMDSTLIQNECIDELARTVGKYDEIAKITRESMLGNLLFEHSLEVRVGLLKGIKREVLDQVLENQITLSPGAETMAKTMKKYNVKLAVASGGFTFFTTAIKNKLNFDYQFANKLEFVDDVLTGKLIKPIYASIDKANSLKSLISSLDLDIKDVMAIGDGSNDIPMLESVPLGFSYHAKPVVNEATSHNINFTDLTSLLFAQGIKKADFVA